jgi:hypothetical protein
MPATKPIRRSTGLQAKELPLIWSTPVPSPAAAPTSSPPAPARSLTEQLESFKEFGQPTRRLVTSFVDEAGRARKVPTYVNEFWTARQRQAHVLHEVSYRACFKPQLPAFFITRLTAPGDSVYDPFMGRGTTPIQAALMGRTAIGNDINPLSAMLARDDRPRQTDCLKFPIAHRWKHRWRRPRCRRTVDSRRRRTCPKARP